MTISSRLGGIQKSWRIGNASSSAFGYFDQMKPVDMTHDVNTGHLLSAVCLFIKMMASNV